MPDGSIVFDTTLDNAKLQKDLAKIKKDIEKLEASVSAQEAKKSPLVQQAQALEQKMKAARTEVQRYGEAWRSGVSGADKDQSAAITQVRQLEAQYAKVTGQIDKIDEKLLPAKDRLDEMKASAGEVEQRLAQAGVNTEKMDRATKKANKSAQRFVLRLREVVRSALVFTLITQALAKFREWMGKVIRTNKEAAAAVAKLKGALLTLAQPLLKLLIPAFTAFVRIIASVVSALVNIVSMLFGTTAQASSEAAEALQEETEALDGVGGAVALNWEAMGDSLNEALGALLIIIGGFISVIGVILLLTGNIPLGLGLLLAGISLFATGMIATNWDEMGGKIGETLGAIFVVIGGFLAVIGIILLLTGNIPLGLGLLIAGISIFAASAAAINGNIAADHVSEMLGAIFSIAGTAMLAIGLLLVLTGIGGPLGIGLMIAGGAAFGAGAVALNWGWIIEKLKGMWSGITNWWDANAAQFFTADYWIGIGKNMLDGLFNGLSSIGSKISEWGSGFIDGVKDFFGIHSPSTEFETLGKYMMLGMEGGIDDNNGVVLAVFSGLLARMLTATQATTSDMRAVFALFLLYLMGEFARGWDGSWQNFSAVVSRNIQSVMRDIDALNAKLASIERNITITITTVHKTIGNSSGFSDSSAARSVAARVAAMPTTLKAIPMATGGVIPPNREFLALYGDQRSGNNIEAPESLLRKIVREESGGGMNTTLLQAILNAIKAGAVVMVDRDQIGRVVYDTYNSEDRRRGVSLTTR